MSDRTVGDEGMQNALSELIVVSAHVLACIAEWREEGFVCGTEDLEQKLSDAITEAKAAQS